MKNWRHIREYQPDIPWFQVADVVSSLAVEYMFLTTDGPDVSSKLSVEPFNAVNEQNDYEVCNFDHLDISSADQFLVDTVVFERPHRRRTGGALFRSRV